MDLTVIFWLYLKAFFILLVGYYLVPAGSMYFLFYVWKREQWKKLRIQERYPDTLSIQREVKSSMVTLLITAGLATLMILMIQAGWTKMYFEISERGWLYFVLSTIGFILLYDSYYYWLHRLMHMKKVFPFIHREHHKSHTPTPWAILSFNPLESVVEFLIYPMVIVFIPLHPVAVLIFVIFNTVVNTLGHIGHEFTPRSFISHPLFGLSTTVTHHEMHHQKVRCNYGLYTTIWDRLMGTNHPNYESTFLAVKDKSKSS